VPPSVQSPHSSAARIGDSANANGAPLVVAVRELHLARPDGQLVSPDAAASELDPRQGVLGVPGEVNPLV
jgi:hypothetical protein